jgi:hypothetical protein
MLGVASITGTGTNTEPRGNRTPFDAVSCAIPDSPRDIENSADRAPPKKRWRYFDEHQDEEE